MHDGVPTYAAALLLGLIAALLVIPLPALQGGGPGWASPQPGQAQALTAHLAFQADLWRRPPLDVARLFVPHGVSLAQVDGNVLVSLAAKLFVRVTGSAPVNWLGWFLGACWVLQPVAAVYAVRGLRVGWLATLAAAVLACAWPALLPLAGDAGPGAHAILLVAIGMAIRRADRAAPWAGPGVLLVIAILVQPDLFVLSAAVLGSVPLQAALLRRAGWRTDAIGYALGVAIALGLDAMLGGSPTGLLDGRAAGGTALSGPGLLGAAGWPGAGTMLLLAAGLVAAIARRRLPRPPLGLLALLASLALLSVLAGMERLGLGGPAWIARLGAVPVLGRAAWPVGYALLLAGVAAADRIGRMARPSAARLIGPVLLLAAVAAQVAEIQPALVRARTQWLLGSSVSAPVVPAGTALFTVAPYPGCTADAATIASAPLMLLDAVRHGAETGDVGLDRRPSWFSCEAVMADALELPLLPHEVRAFSGRQIQAPLRPILLGDDARCTRRPPGLAGDPADAMDIVMCGRDVEGQSGEPVPPGARPPAVPLPFEAGSDGLGMVLGYGWRLGLGGGAWSEGPQSSILIPVIPGHRLELRLRASGIGVRQGSGRIVAVTAGRVPMGQFTLPDGIMTDVVVAIPASTIESGFLRVALAVGRPVDPATRALAAPVRGAAVLLSGLTLRVEDPVPP